jgi:DNA-binding NarL/FixJ family response regulator
MAPFPPSSHDGDNERMAAREISSGSRPDAAADGPAASMHPVSVLVVDDQLPFRAVARTVVRIASGFDVVGEAETGEEAVDKVATLDPDLVLMDINMPGINGIEATARIAREHPRTSVILLSTYKVSDLPTDAMDCGAIGYIHKEDFDPDVLEQVWSTRPR